MVTVTPIACAAGTISCANSAQIGSGHWRNASVVPAGGFFVNGVVTGNAFGCPVYGARSACAVVAACAAVSDGSLELDALGCDVAGKIAAAFV
jgi:hypothetical protein